MTQSLIECAEMLYFLERSAGLMWSSSTSLMILVRCSGEKAEALMVLRKRKEV